MTVEATARGEMTTARVVMATVPDVPRGPALPEPRARGKARLQAAPDEPAGVRTSPVNDPQGLTGGTTVVTGAASGGMTGATTVTTGEGSGAMTGGMGHKVEAAATGTGAAARPARRRLAPLGVVGATRAATPVNPVAGGPAWRSGAAARG